MPRYFILTGIPHGEAKPVVILDPSHSVDDQKVAYREFARKDSDPDYSEVQLWSSDAGITAKRKLRPSEPAELSEQETESDPEKPKARGNPKPKPKPAEPKD